MNTLAHTALLLTALTLCACTGGKDSGGGATDSTGATDDTGTGGTDDTGKSTATDDTDGTTDTGTDACEAVTPGDDWAWYGECPQMRTPVVISVAGCALSLDYESVGGMTMGMPYAATVAGSTVTFADDNAVTGCVATLEGPDRMTGTCGGGCTFELER